MSLRDKLLEERKNEMSSINENFKAMTYQEIGKVTGLTKMGAKKVKDRALTKMFVEIKKDNRNFDNYEAFLTLYQVFAEMGIETEIDTLFKEMPDQYKELIKKDAKDHLTQ